MNNFSAVYYHLGIRPIEITLREGSTSKAALITLGEDMVLVIHNENAWVIGQQLVDILKSTQEGLS